jgi:cobalt-zinc-cadmium efflux system protein
MTGHHHHISETSHGKKRLVLAIGITGTWFLIELAGGIYTNSLALLADAAHMLIDLAALSLSYFALTISSRPAPPEKTYGYRRVEILAALANGVLLIVIALYIFHEAWQRLWVPQEVKSLPMLIVAATGLAANLVTAKLLYASRNESLNLRGAFLHVLGDTLGSLGAITAGILMLFFHWYPADPIVSVIVGALILFNSWRLVAESVDVLLEGVPRHLDITVIYNDLRGMKEVASLHDLHVWSIATYTIAMSCHIVLKQDADPMKTLEKAEYMMREKYGIEHTTIQMESEIRTAGVVVKKIGQ